MSQTFLTVIIPAFNESANFSRGTLQSVVDFLSHQPYTWELLLVNDGSTDSTLPQLKRFAATSTRVSVIDLPHQGKAATIMAGVDHAHGQHIIFTDMDQSTPITEVPRLLAAFSAGADLVIGSRSNRAGAPVFRQILAYGMIILRTLLLRLPYRDTQCGFKGFTSAAAQKLFPILRRVHPPQPIVGAAVNPGFDVELLYLARKLHLSVKEVPVVWHHQQSSRVKFFKDAFSGLSELLLVRIRSLTNAYSL